ncbi:MAG: hypothetical protein AAGE94_05810 [Acidobacteriota bacterium]
MRIYDELPVRSRDRLHWGEENGAYLPFLVATQLLWPVGLYGVVGGHSSSWWGPTCALAFIGLASLPTAWRERRDSPQLELWPARGMFVWRPRADYVACRIDSLVVTPREGEWAVEAAAHIPRRTDDELPPRTRVLLETTATKAAAVDMALRWANRLELPAIEVACRPGSATVAPTVLGRLGALDGRFRGDTLDIPDPRVPVGIAAGLFVAFFLVAAPVAPTLGVPGSDPRVWLAVSAATVVTIAGVGFVRRRRVIDRLHVDLVAGTVRHWKGPSDSSAGRTTPWVDLQLVFARHDGAYGVFLEVDGGRRFALASRLDLDAGRQALEIWADRLDRPIVDHVRPPTERVDDVEAEAIHASTRDV